MFIIFASNPTRRFYFDGVVFASIIEHGPYEKLFNPHHLLYTPLFYLMHNAIQAVLGKPIQALYMLQWANIVLGTLGVLLMWRLLVRLVEDRGLALLVTLLGCFSFTYWHYTTDADVYIISTCFLLLAADRLEWIIRHREPRTSDFIAIGLLQSASILTHQLNVFWAVCVMVCLAMGVVPGSKSARWRWWWTYALSLSIPVAAAYFGIGILVLGHNTVDSFLYWITEYGHEPTYWVSSWKEIPYLTLNGYLMVFFHRYSIVHGILDYDLRQAFEEGRFFKGFIKKIFGYYSLGFLFFCYLSALYNLKKYLVEFRRRAIFLFSWLAPYVIFQLFFMPTNHFYKLFIFVPLLAVFGWFAAVDTSKELRWLKLGIFAIFIVFTIIVQPILGILVFLFVLVFEIFRDRRSHLYRWGLFILITFLPLYNYIAGIAPESELKNNPEVVTALALRDDFHDGDLLIFAGGYDYPGGWIIGALTPAKVYAIDYVYKMPDEKRERVFRDVVDSGGRVLLHPNVQENGPPLEEFAQDMGITQDQLLDMLHKYEWRPAFEEGGKEYVEMVVK